MALFPEDGWGVIPVQGIDNELLTTIRAPAACLDPKDLPGFGRDGYRGSLVSQSDSLGIPIGPQLG